MWRCTAVHDRPSTSANSRRPPRLSGCGLDKLTSQHVEYIFDVMSNTTQPIKNIMAYLRTTILNAPTTMEHYYQAQGNWLTAQNRKK